MNFQSVSVELFTFNPLGYITHGTNRLKIFAGYRDSSPRYCRGSEWHNPKASVPSVAPWWIGF